MFSEIQRVFASYGVILTYLWIWMNSEWTQLSLNAADYNITSPINANYNYIFTALYRQYKQYNINILQL